MIEVKTTIVLLHSSQICDIMMSNGQHYFLLIAGIYTHDTELNENVQPVCKTSLICNQY